MAVADNKILLALDVGSKRIGVATASLTTKLPQPLKTIDNTDDVVGQIKQLVEQEQIAAIIIGLPRGLSLIRGNRHGTLRDPHLAKYHVVAAQIEFGGLRVQGDDLLSGRRGGGRRLPGLQREGDQDRALKAGTGH